MDAVSEALTLPRGRTVPEPHADIAVVGGGIIGRAIACALARRRAGRIVLIDDGALGGEASPAAAGVLAVASSRAPRGILLELGRRSLAMYPAFLEALRADSGVEVALRRPGLLALAASEEEMQALETRAGWRRAEGFRAEVIDAHALRRLHPEVPERFCGAVAFADVAEVDRDRLLQALAAATAKHRIAEMSGVAVTAIAVSGRRATSLLAGSTRVTVGVVVIAAGWWSAELVRSLGAALPLRPARGEMLALRFPHPHAEAIVAHGDTLVIPRGRETAWIGATVEFDANPVPTAAARQRLHQAAAAVLPCAATAAVIQHWAGVRPCSTVRRPIIDRVPGLENVIVATGHHRSGFLLAPLTAEIVASTVAGGPLPVDLHAVAWREPRGRKRRERTGGA